MFYLAFLLAAFSFLLFSEEGWLDIQIPVVDMKDYASPDRRDFFIDTLPRHERSGFFLLETRASIKGRFGMLPLKESHSSNKKANLRRNALSKS